MDLHYTATAFIIQQDKLLFVKHPKLGSWMPPGGHVESNELPHMAAYREVEEETGLKIQFLSEDHVEVDPSERVFSLPRPFLCLQHFVTHDTPHHRHFDFNYVATPVGGTLKGSDPLKWFTREEIEHEKEIFYEIRQAALKVLELFSPSRSSSYQE